jgi:hypothetical protein
MTLVSSARVRRADHVDVGQVGIVGRDVALQLAHNRVMWLSGVGERIGRVCLRHATNYAYCAKWSRIPASMATWALTASRRVVDASRRGAAIRIRSVRRVPESIGSKDTVPRSRTRGN